MSGDKSSQILLSDLKELYDSFKTQHPSAKIGLVKFYSLNPPCCKLNKDLLALGL